MNYEWMNHHPNSLSNFPIGFSRPKINRDNDLLVRVCDYYEKRMNESRTQGSLIWKNNVDRHSEITNVIRNRDYDQLHIILSNMFSSPLTHGFAGGDVFTNILLNSKELAQRYSTYQYDKLLSLAELVGAIEVFDPAEYYYVKGFNKYLEMTPDILIDQISDKLSIDLSSPNLSGGLFGLVTNKGSYSERDFFAIAIAYHVKNFVAKSKDVTICDIGGGAGHVAYYLKKFGFDNVTIVDLPNVSLVQMYFLETNLGRDKVKLISPDEFHGKYDIVINMDSLVEMNVSSAEQYISKIAKNTEHFITINTEKTTNTFNVSDLCKDLKKTSRQIWYMCPGYVFEEYKGR